MNEYVVFLVIGTLCVLVDGWVIYRSGRTTLADAYDSPATADAANRMVIVTFLLVLLGTVALVSTMDVSAAGALPRVVTKIGILLLLLAVAHGVVTVVLSRLRNRQRAAMRDEEALLTRRTGRTASRSQPASRRDPEPQG